mgnify:CR=1 FL=1
MRIHQIPVGICRTIITSNKPAGNARSIATVIFICFSLLVYIAMGTAPAAMPLPDRVEALESDQTAKKYTIEDLKQIRETYRAKLRKLRQAVNYPAFTERKIA